MTSKQLAKVRQFCYPFRKTAFLLSLVFAVFGWYLTYFARDASPFPYAEQEFRFKNSQAGIEIDGILSVPVGKESFPVIIILHGCAVDRNGGYGFEHEPRFSEQIADFLGRHGIGVLRYDQRGVGRSDGDFASSTLMEFSEDATYAVAAVRKMLGGQARAIGLLGHSDGGAVAAIAATKCESISGLILMAAAGRRWEENNRQLLIEHAKLEGIGPFHLQQALKADAALGALMESGRMDGPAIEEAKSLIMQLGSRSPDKEVARLFANGRRFCQKFDPEPVYRKVACPVLAMNGGRDIYVQAKENLRGIERALDFAGNKDVTVIEIPELNHVFCACKTGALREYSMPCYWTLSSDVLMSMTAWIKEKCN